MSPSGSPSPVFCGLITAFFQLVFAASSSYTRTSRYWLLRR
jgi:hypothetical protein